MAARADQVVADLQAKALPQVRQQYKTLLEYVRSQLTIETTENVTRLNVGQKK